MKRRNITKRLRHLTLAQRRHVLRGSIGFCGAFAFCWVACAFFKPSSPRYVWDEAIGATVSREGSFHWETREGFAVTRIGSHGMVEPPTGKARGPTAILWGDSHVEATQVWDVQKMHRVAGRSLSGVPGFSGAQLVAMGMSGAMMADYIQWIPVYERALPTAERHIILLTSVDELLPDKSSALHAQFTATPHLSIEFEAPRRASQLGRLAMDLTYWSRLQFIHIIIGEAKGAVRFSEMSFFPIPWHHSGARKPDPKGGEHLTTEDKRAITYILDRLRAASSRPLIIVWAASSPHLESGYVTLPTSSPALTALLSAECSRRSIRFIDATPNLAAVWSEQKRLPRGFNNGHPGSGHFNRYGHAALAAAIERAMTKTFPVLQATRQESPHPSPAASRSVGAEL